MKQVAVAENAEENTKICPGGGTWVKFRSALSEPELDGDLFIGTGSLLVAIQYFDG